MESFTYDPIDLEGSSFRLLRLLSGDGPVIHCQLFEALLHRRENAISYEALSYTWGPNELSESIEVNGKILRITTNLLLALRRLRFRDQDRMLWVDAICIDQTSSRERGHQVRQMGEIYKQAQGVIFWLGEATDEINVTMDYLQLVQHEGQKHGTNGWSISDKRWLGIWTTVKSTFQYKGQAETEALLSVGLRSLLGRPWFTRVWILQEVANAHTALVCCGTKSVKAVTFALAPRLMNVIPNRQCQSVLDNMPGAARKNSWWSQSRHLHTLLTNFKVSEAHDPRDMIYALLRLSSDARNSPHIFPDYGKTEREVVRSVVSFMYQCDANSAPTGQPHTIRGLLQQLETDAKPTAKGPVPLIWAANNGNWALVRLLLEQGFHTEAKNHGGLTALLLAAQQGYHGIVQLLLDKGCDIESKDGSKMTPLIWGARIGSITVVQLLLDKGVKTEAKDKNSKTPLMWAAKNGHVDVVQLLLNKECDIESKDCENMTPLIWAAKNGNENVVQLLLEKGCDVESKDRGNMTPLMWAAENGHEAVVQLLLEKGCDIEQDNKMGRTSLWLAVQQSRGAVVRLLLEKGSHTESRDDNGLTPLLWILQTNYEGCEAIAQLLLEKGANAEAKDKNGMTPLMLAVQNGNMHVVQLLFENGCNTESEDHVNMTALRRAVDCRNMDIIQPLLMKGSVTEAEDKNGLARSDVDRKKRKRGCRPTSTYEGASDMLPGQALLKVRPRYTRLYDRTEFIIGLSDEAFSSAK